MTLVHFVEFWNLNFGLVNCSTAECFQRPHALRWSMEIEEVFTRGAMPIVLVLTLATYFVYKFRERS